MSVKEYSLKRDGDQKVSADFRVREFRCKDGSDKILLSPETVKIIQSVRDYFGKPVTINSAYRTPQYNKKVGGASNSQHVKGTACDIAVKDVPPKAVAAYLEAFFPKTDIPSSERSSSKVSSRFSFSSSVLPASRMASRRAALNLSRTSTKPWSSK